MDGAMYPLLILMEGHMRKVSLAIAAAMLAASLPALAQENESREHSAMQHYGGHGRHMHRGWSGVSGGGPVRSVCWIWNGLAWAWVCR